MRLEWRVEKLDHGATALTGKEEVGRHFLAGQPVHCGDLLELEIGDNSWVTGRYEWTKEAGASLVVADAARPLSECSNVRWPS